MTTFKVTLLVTPNEGEDAPSKWAWHDLLGCEVEQLSCVHIVKEGEQSLPTEGMTLYERCLHIYENARDGQRAVEEYVKKNHPNVPWALCKGCESMEPYDEWGDCLVCGCEIEAHELAQQG